MNNEFYKIFVVALIVGLNWAGLSAVGRTVAYFNDTETSADNFISAGSLGVTLDSMEPYASGLMYPSDATTTAISISNTGTLDSQYVASTTVSGTDTTACDYITMTATAPGTSYSGLIKNFISSATTTTPATWNFSFTVVADAPASVWGKTCFFTWSYRAWQDNVLDGTSGFTDIKEKLGSVRIGKAVVLNEILADPSSSAIAPANKEFIELYNNGNTSIDVAGWKVSEMSGVTEKKYTITATSISPRAVPYGGTTVIPAKGFITLLLNDSTALNNAGDTIRFYDATDTKIDEFAYTTAKPKGYSYARIPDGIGAWVDPIPTPGEPNVEDIGTILETAVLKPNEVDETTAEATTTETEGAGAITSASSTENSENSNMQETQEIKETQTAEGTIGTTEKIIEKTEEAMVAVTNTTITPDTIPAVVPEPAKMEETPTVIASQTPPQTIQETKETPADPVVILPEASKMEEVTSPSN